MQEPSDNDSFLAGTDTNLDDDESKELPSW